MLLICIFLFRENVTVSQIGLAIAKTYHLTITLNFSSFNIFVCFPSLFLKQYMNNFTSHNFKHHTYIGQKKQQQKDKKRNNQAIRKTQNNITNHASYLSAVSICSPLVIAIVVAVSPCGSCPFVKINKSRVIIYTNNNKNPIPIDCTFAQSNKKRRKTKKTKEQLKKKHCNHRIDTLLTQLKTNP